MTEQMQKWVNALRSGEYRQTKFRLKEKNKYCCMGVLCDLYYKETGNGEWILYSPERWSFRTDESHSKNRTIPPRDVWEWLGVDPEFSEINQIFGYKNDGEKRTFEEIADFIENDLEEKWLIDKK